MSHLPSSQSDFPSSLLSFMMNAHSRQASELYARKLLTRMKMKALLHEPKGQVVTMHGLQKSSLVR
jgi:hypothetical protein